MSPSIASLTPIVSVSDHLGSNPGGEGIRRKVYSLTWCKGVRILWMQIFPTKQAFVSSSENLFLGTFF